MHGLLKDHFAPIAPNLNDVLFQVVELQYFLVYDLNDHGAEVCIFVVLTTGFDLVQFVKRHRVHDFVHEFLRGLGLLAL